jgi:phage tail sheath protein FI
VAELLSAGIFIEEVPSQVQTIQAVSTSNVGGVGFTEKGPTNEATLVTSFPQFFSRFGGISSNGLLPISMAAFFANGGRRAFINRVVPSDAVLSEAKVQSQTNKQQIETGDGATLNFAKTSATTVVKANDGDSPVIPGTFNLRWRTAGTLVATEDLRNRADGADVALVSGTDDYEARIAPGSLPAFDEALDSVVRGTASLIFDPDGNGDRTIAIPAGTGSIVTVTTVEGSVIRFDHRSGFLSVKFAGSESPGVGAAGDLRLGYTPTSETLTAVDDGATGKLLGAGLSTATGSITTVAFAALIDGETFTLDDGVNPAVVFEFDTVPDGVIPGNRTVDVSADVTADDVRDRIILAVNAANTAGILNITAANGGVGLVSLTNTVEGAVGNVAILETVADGGFSVTGMVGGVDSTIDYGDGSYDITFETAPHDEAGILVDYQIDAWDLDPISAGVWGDDLQIQINGNADFLTVATGQFSRFDVNVALRNSSSPTVFDVQETFEELVFNDPTSTSFWADVINELSDLISVTDPGGNEAPGQLQAVGRGQVVAGGDETAGGSTIVTSLASGGLPVRPRTFMLTYEGTTTGAGTTLTVTDDGNGNLTGDVDPTGNNTINYTTGALDVTLLEPIVGGILVQTTWWTAPTETQHLETFGDTTKVTYDTVAAVVQSWDAGSDGTFTPSTYGRNQFTNPSLEAGREGVFALNRVEELMQVIVPDFVGDVTITGDLIDYAEGRAFQPSGGDRFLILQPPVGSDAQEAVDWLRNDLGRNTKWGAIYWPHVRVADPLSPTGQPITVPALGHVAGIYARTDNNRNVGKAPAGTVDGKLNFLLGLEFNPDQGERDLVYPANINPLINTPQTGLVVWGARTFASTSEAEWRFIQARRTFMFVEKSVFNATHWIAFENNGPALWAKIKAQLGGFLTPLHNDGLFAGNTPTESFFVIVDETNNNAESSQVVIDVGLAPNRPAEFIRFKFSQKTLS